MTETEEMRLAAHMRMKTIKKVTARHVWTHLIDDVDRDGHTFIKRFN
jgi:hypothetical protein